MANREFYFGWKSHFWINYWIRCRYLIGNPIVEHSVNIRTTTWCLYQIWPLIKNTYLHENGMKYYSFMSNDIIVLQSFSKWSNWQSAFVRRFTKLKYVLKIIQQSDVTIFDIVYDYLNSHCSLFAHNLKTYFPLKSHKCISPAEISFHLSYSTQPEKILFECSLYFAKCKNASENYNALILASERMFQVNI